MGLLAVGVREFMMLLPGSVHHHATLPDFKYGEVVDVVYPWANPKCQENGSLVPSSSALAQRTVLALFSRIHVADRLIQCFLGSQNESKL